MTGGAFISYRREDAAGFAGRLCDSLERHLPTEPIFRDVDGLSPGQDFVAAIEARLRQCRVCLAVIGRDWLNARDAEGRRRLDQPDDFVRLELTAALARPEVLIVPVLGSLTTGDLTLRLVVGDDVLAPTAYPIHMIRAGATQRVAVQFEVPPATTSAVLRATAGDQGVDVPLMLR